MKSEGASQPDSERWQRERSSLAEARAYARMFIFQRGRLVYQEADGTLTPVFSVRELAANLSRSLSRSGRPALRGLTARRVRAMIRRRWPSLAKARGEAPSGTRTVT
jgi:hypothetical protein